MNAAIRTIYKSFEGKLVCKAETQLYICRALVQMPQNIADFVTKNCWFFASMEDAWAFTFTGNDLKDQNLIFLSDELFLQDDAQIYFTIAHEIGHVILKHRNSTLVRQSRGEIKRQEQEADAFAARYFNREV